MAGRWRRGLIAFALLGLVGCTAHHAKPAATPSAAGGLFAATSGDAVACLQHQTQAPGPLYTAGQNADTGHILVMLQYYTTNGAKRFCDGAGPNAFDRQWIQLYVALGGAPQKVAGLSH